MRLGLFERLRNSSLNRDVLVLALLFCFALSSVAQQNAPPPAAQDKPVAADNGSTTGYVIGVADVLDINVWKEPEISRSALAVRPDGMISMPLIGEVKVSGMTPSQVHDLLVTMLGRYVSAVRVTVTVAEIKSKFVYVTGEVKQPGTYTLLAPINVLQIITKAGGLTPFARRKSIMILRSVDGKEQRLTVNYNKLLRGEYAELNIHLLPGDTVVVP